MKLIDPQHPFFRSPLRRVATVVLPAAWGVVELINGALGWGFVFLAAAFYAALELFVFVKRAPDAAAAIEGQAGEEIADREGKADDKRPQRD